MSARPCVVAGVLALLHIVLALLVFEPAPHPGGDNAAYLALAHALLRGEYRDVWDPAAPIHTQYPPVFPALLALGLLLGLGPWIGFKLLVVGFSAAAVALSYLWIRRRRRPLLALGVAGMVAASPGVLELSHWELSDVPFWAFSMAALLGWERLPRDDKTRALVASLFSVLAYLTRSAGLPLLVAALVWLLVQRRWRQLALYLAVVAPPVAAWWLWGRTGRGYGGYVLVANPYAPAQGELDARGVLARMGANAWQYLDQHTPTLVFGNRTGLMVIISAALIALAVCGWARRVWRPGVAEILVPLYVVMLLVWPTEWSGERMLLPIFPLLLLYAGDALWRLGRTVPAWPAGLPGATAAALIMALALPGLGANIRHGTACIGEYLRGERYPCLRGEWQDFYAVVHAAAQVLPRGAVVVSRKPPTFYAASGLRGRMYPFSQDSDAFFGAARTMGARYVVMDYLDPVSSFYLAPILKRYPEAFCEVYSLGRSRAALFALRPAGACGS